MVQLDVDDLLFEQPYWSLGLDNDIQMVDTLVIWQAVEWAEFEMVFFLSFHKDDYGNLMTCFSMKRNELCSRCRDAYGSNKFGWKLKVNLEALAPGVRVVYESYYPRRLTDTPREDQGSEDQSDCNRPPIWDELQEQYVINAWRKSVG